MTKEIFYDYFGIYSFNLWNTLIEIKDKAKQASEKARFCMAMGGVSHRSRPIRTHDVGCKLALLRQAIGNAKP